MAGELDGAAGRIIDALLEECLLEIDLPTEKDLEEAGKHVEERMKEILSKKIKERMDSIKQTDKPATSRRMLFGLKE